MLPRFPFPAVITPYSPQREIKSGVVVIVDPEFVWLLWRWKWCLNNSGYVSNGRSLLHKRVLPSAVEIDHINRNKLDNRRVNLRAISHSQNHFNTNIRPDNTSGYKGVTWGRKTRKWQAQIGLQGKCLFLGVYLEWWDALCARKAAELLYIEGLQ